MSANCTSYLDIHWTKGNTQLVRFADALDPLYANIDDRTLADLIRFTAKLSNHIIFYNTSNIANGNWNSLFNNDITAVLCLFNDVNLEDLYSQFAILKKELQFEKDQLANQKILTTSYFDEYRTLIKSYSNSVVFIPNDFYLKEYFTASLEKLEAIFQTIESDLNIASNHFILFQNKTFLHKFNALVGLLNEWKTKSITAILQSLQSYSQHSPHYALFLSFVQLYQEAQKELNQFTKKHLDFYYKEVLQLQPQKAQPNLVHLCIELNKNVASFLVAKDSIFVAGKNPDGKNRFYASTHDNIINHAQVKNLFAVYKNEQQLWSKDWTEDNGNVAGYDIFSDGTLPEVGYAIASSIFLLQSGERIIKLNTDKPFDASKFKFFLSGAKGWLEVAIQNNNTLIINEANEAITGFDKTIHQGVPFHTQLPILKIIAKNRLDTLSLSSLKIEVEVNNAKHFKLYNPYGEVDVNKDFFPFGEYPENGNSVLFTSNEFFQKENAKGTITFESDNLTTASTQCLQLQNSNWKLLSTSNKSRQTRERGKSSIDNKTISFTNKSLINSTFAEDKNITQVSKSGYIKIALNNSNYKSGIFLKTYFTEASKDKGVLPVPFKISKFTFNYTASLQLHKATNEDYELFKILPFGYQNTQSTTSKEVAGTIFIGLENVVEKSTVNLLLQVIEGSANPLKELNQLSFQFLINNQWENIPNIIDGTLNLSQSGIVQFAIPEFDNSILQTKMPKDIFWIRIDVPNDLDAVCNVVGVHTQAIKARLFDADKNGLQFMENIASGTISKLYTSIPTVKKVHQHYASFGGQLPENDKTFYMRSSEELRHKNRAITSWDYERMILANFPSIQEVKCLNHFEYQNNSISSTSAGFVTLIPIAKTVNTQKNELLKPFVNKNTIQKMEQFLSDKTSPHITVLVKTPKLEELSFECNLITKDGNWDEAYIKDEVAKRIKIFLCPWLSSDEFSFSGSIHKASIIQLIDEMEFVDYIQDLKITQTIDGNSNVVDDIISSTVFSVFVPGPHNITIQKQKCC